MGKLRVQPKEGSLSGSRFQALLGILREAEAVSTTSHTFYDLDDDEEPSRVRKDILFVAGREGIQVDIRRLRGRKVLQLMFSRGSRKPVRISAAEARQRILDALGNEDGPMKKSVVLEASGINPGTWNPRITELLSSGKVKRLGLRREAVYSLA